MRRSKISWAVSLFFSSVWSDCGGESSCVIVSLSEIILLSLIICFEGWFMAFVEWFVSIDVSGDLFSESWKRDLFVEVKSKFKLSRVERLPVPSDERLPFIVSPPGVEKYPLAERSGLSITGILLKRLTRVELRELLVLLELKWLVKLEPLWVKVGERGPFMPRCCCCCCCCCCSSDLSSVNMSSPSLSSLLLQPTSIFVSTSMVVSLGCEGLWFFKLCLFVCVCSCPSCVCETSWIGYATWASGWAALFKMHLIHLTIVWGSQLRVKLRARAPVRHTAFRYSQYFEGGTQIWLEINICFTINVDRNPFYCKTPDFRRDLNPEHKNQCRKIWRTTYKLPAPKPNTKEPTVWINFCSLSFISCHQQQKFHWYLCWQSECSRRSWATITYLKNNPRIVSLTKLVEWRSALPKQKEIERIEAIFVSHQFRSDGRGWCRREHQQR